MHPNPGENPSLLRTCGFTSYDPAHTALEEKKSHILIDHYPIHAASCKILYEMFNRRYML